MAAYARQAKDSDLIQWVTEIKVRAERRLGEMIREQKETVGLAQGRRSDLLPEENEVQKPTLTEVGIDYKLSMRSQQLAAMPEEHFETAVAVAKEQVAQVTTENVLRLSKLIAQNDSLERALAAAEGQRAQWRAENPAIYAENVWTPIAAKVEDHERHLRRHCRGDRLHHHGCHLRSGWT